MAGNFVPTQFKMLSSDRFSEFLVEIGAGPRPLHLKISRSELAQVLDQLRAQKLPPSLLGMELQVGYFNGDAVFSFLGTTIRCPATGFWHGFVSLPLGLLIKSVEAIPAIDHVLIEYVGEELRVAATVLRARWIEPPPWVRQFAVPTSIGG